jgi:hypothetical protein
MGKKRTRVGPKKKTVESLLDKLLNDHCETTIEQYHQRRRLDEHIACIETFVDWLQRATEQGFLVKMWNEEDEKFQVNEVQMKLLYIHLDRWKEKLACAKVIRDDPRSTNRDIEIVLFDTSFHVELCRYLDFTLDWRYTEPIDTEEHILDREQYWSMSNMVGHMAVYIKRIRQVFDTVFDALNQQFKIDLVPHFDGVWNPWLDYMAGHLVARKPWDWNKY